MKVGLYFGSFNPIHIGHLAIANYFVAFSDIDKLWFVISPHNPLKEKKSLLNDQARFDMVELAIANDINMEACNVEFNLPQPSFTIDTLTYLSEKHPNYQFVLLMGSDGLSTFNKWKNADVLIKNYPRYVYPRNTDNTEVFQQHKNIKVITAPKIEISSTFIRNSIAKGKDIRHFLPYKVYEYIDKKGYYLK